jgi:hypothetical protein
MPTRPRLLIAIAATSLLLIVVGACTFTVGVSDLQNANCGAGQKACPDSQGVNHCIGLDQPQYGCGNVGCGICPLMNATSRCDQSNKCSVAVCNTGYAHCSSDPTQGCETSIYTDVSNCGLDPSTACGHTCGFVTSAPNVLQPGCINGVCQISGCQPGFNDCDKAVNNGCECPSPGTCNPTTGACVFPDGGRD